ncbi:hypothetical protein BCV69DRAFT_315249 [Microstroma glucosiphilum]|uniref:Thioredoxin domain-containing protein n=1 Tax=Pseudomicrostroma glucosiphilum TaxID=1684307 RepID=A0A316U4K8_9BASI|nr:hypothetical protein BCV69DRAFT_315249 [Pseudomicrostroma glucosiphilum]PWN17865.1 hypothetical protein BCV69DRAFT_315249 [Pseudomicrostroma glucosiphilum]
MLTILPPSFTLTDDSLQELLLSSSSSSKSWSAREEACYLIFFSGTLPVLPGSHTASIAGQKEEEEEEEEEAQGDPLSESQLTSLKEGLWCPDCRAALLAVLSIFSPGSLAATTASSTSTSTSTTTGAASAVEARALLLQVSREQWKDRTDGGHVYRKRYDVQSVPTVLKWIGGKEVGRLVDEECADVDKIRALVQG